MKTWPIILMLSAAQPSKASSLLPDRFLELYETEHGDPDPWQVQALDPATPSQPKGPFYPIRIPDESDTDLTQINGRPPAQGIPLYIQGQVMTLDGNPLENATIEIWQACYTGKYNHPKDTNPARTDPNFQYYGATKTDHEGWYIFKTILPGAYPASSDWIRPPHIHYAIKKAGYRSLITLSYFDGAFLGDEGFAEKLNHWNREDRILRALTPEEQKRLIVKFVPQDRDQLPLVGVFNIYLKPHPV